MREYSGFFQQTASIVGLIVSFITAVTPLFINSPINAFFLGAIIVQPISFLVLIVGISIVWYFTQISTSPTLKVFPRKNKQYHFVEGYWIDLSTNGFIKIAIFSVILFGILFIAYYVFGVADDKIQSFFQGLSYLFMFLSLIWLFALLYAQTKAQQNFMDLIERFPLNILETLNKYKLISSGIEISHNEILSAADLRKHKLDATQYLGSKKIKVKTVTQAEKEISLIVDYSGTQIFKILPKK